MIIDIDAYITILIKARRAILAERGSNPISRGLVHDLTQIINALGHRQRIAKNEGLYCI